MHCRIESLAENLNSQLSVSRAKAADAEGKAADAEAKAAESEGKAAESEAKAAEAEVALQKTSETVEALKHTITELEQRLSRQLSKETEGPSTLVDLSTDVLQQSADCSQEETLCERVNELEAELAEVKLVEQQQADCLRGRVTELQQLITTTQLEAQIALETALSMIQQQHQEHVSALRRTITELEAALEGAGAGQSEIKRLLEHQQELENALDDVCTGVIKVSQLDRQRAQASPTVYSVSLTDSFDAASVQVSTQRQQSACPCISLPLCITHSCPPSNDAFRFHSASFIVVLLQMMHFASIVHHS